jgi:P-type Ca2+ transporter type 2C
MSSTKQGLESVAVKRLQELHGYNELPFTDSKSLLRTVTQVLTEPMFALLICAALIYLVIGSFEDTVLLSGFIALSIGITIYQERKSERAIDALKDLSSPRAIVKRDGETRRIPSREVVVGDLLILEEGDRIAADATILTGNDLLVDDSLLTGESEPVTKTLGDLVYSGSLVVRGGGTAVVKAIGLQTEIGTIGKSLKQITLVQSPLQLDIRTLIRRFAIFGVCLSLIVCIGYGMFYGQWLDGVLAGITLIMALLPEEFTVILTVFMALGVWRISRQQVLTRSAPVIETLGSITTLCVDKTGTLTLNKMSLSALVTNEAPDDIQVIKGSLDPAQKELLSYALLASEAEPFDPMEQAFDASMRALSPDHIVEYSDYRILHDYGLTPELPAMTHLWGVNGTSEDCLVAMKGSPEAVMALCGLTAERRHLIEKQIQYMASQGLRLLGVAKARFQKGNEAWPESVTSFKFEWLGLTGLKDPLRPEVPESVQQCHEAGIRVIMITGDHAVTAKAIATQAGINSSLVLSGSEITGLDDEQLSNAVKDVCVFVRIKPDQKLRLVRALQKNGEIVAMTGDGINDAPALKAAHVGISMGLRGTDVAREASSLVLLNDDFSSIVNAIRQGRQIYDNLQKAVAYVVAVHVPIAGAAFVPLLFGLPPMLTPIHILFLEMIIDPACAIVFETEAPEANVMQRPPRNTSQTIFDYGSLLLPVMQGVGLFAVVAGLYVGLQTLDYSQTFATTVAFGAMILGNLLLVVISRSRNKSFFQTLKLPNSAQYWISGVAIGLFLIIVSIPFLRDRFKFTELTATSGMLIFLAGIISLSWFEAVKHLKIRKLL